jgi:hypothetical protein
LGGNNHLTGKLSDKIEKTIIYNSNIELGVNKSQENKQSKIIQKSFIDYSKGKHLKTIF